MDIGMECRASLLNTRGIMRINLRRAKCIKERVDPIKPNNVPSLCNEYLTTFFFG